MPDKFKDNFGRNVQESPDRNVASFGVNFQLCNSDSTLLVSILIS